jgi:hypothetical protein
MEYSNFRMALNTAFYYLRLALGYVALLRCPSHPRTLSSTCRCYVRSNQESEQNSILLFNIRISSLTDLLLLLLFLWRTDHLNTDSTSIYVELVGYDLSTANRHVCSCQLTNNNSFIYVGMFMIHVPNSDCVAPMAPQLLRLNR